MRRIPPRYRFYKGHHVFRVFNFASLRVQRGALFYTQFFAFTFLQRGPLLYAKFLVFLLPMQWQD